MSELCMECRFRRQGDDSPLVGSGGGVNAPGAQAVINQQQYELQSLLDLENHVVEAGSGQLSMRPMRHDWCSARSKIKEGDFYFTDWLTTPACSKFRCAAGRDECGRCATGEGECVAGRNIGSDDEAAPVIVGMPAAPPVTTARVPIELTQTREPRDWKLPLGEAHVLGTTKRPLANALGTDAFSIDYVLQPSGQFPLVWGKGLAQTYLIFGGPGAGKTFYFRYLLAHLLGHPARPGCLLLDAKGVLTDWLQRVLEFHDRGEDLRVLGAGQSQNAFNVFGDDLPPGELGKLLAEVVLAGAAGVDEGWSVFVSDLIESSSVVLSALDGKLTATSLLGAILYRKEYEKPSGERYKEYPIRKMAKKIRASHGVDAMIAADRIEEYFATTEDRQRRFVRQLIERTMGGLMSPDWAYLSDTTKENSLYSGIVHRGLVVSVAVGQGSPAFQRSMSTLVKALFQQAVLADLARATTEAAATGEEVETPFFILACDEYAQAVTEGETGLVSDSRFFSLAREAGCMSVLALQSVATGRSRFPASMHDRWDGILGNVTVKMFMRVNDTETAKMGSELSGTTHEWIPLLSKGMSATGLSLNDSSTMFEHPVIPPWYLTNRMPQGYAFVQGTLDGVNMPVSTVVKVPDIKYPYDKAPKKATPPDDTAAAGDPAGGNGSVPAGADGGGKVDVQGDGQR